MKQADISRVIDPQASRPARGAWIETAVVAKLIKDIACRAPHGARGLKHGCDHWDNIADGRAPHGARGLKHRAHPLRRTRIVAPRTGRVD